MTNWYKLSLITLIVFGLGAFAGALIVMDDDVDMNGYSIYEVSSIDSEEGVYIPIVVADSLEVNEPAVFIQGFHTGGHIVPVGEGVIWAGVPGQSLAGVRIYELQMWDVGYNHWADCVLAFNQVRCQNATDYVG